MISERVSRMCVLSAMISLYMSGSILSRTSQRVLKLLMPDP